MEINHLCVHQGVRNEQQVNFLLAGLDKGLRTSILLHWGDCLFVTESVVPI